MKILRSKFFRKILIVSFSLIIVVVIGISIINKSWDEVAGIIGTYLPDKFCDDPASPGQNICTKFITNVLAAGTPYQNVDGDVNISGTLAQSGGYAYIGGFNKQDRPRAGIDLTFNLNYIC